MSTISAVIASYKYCCLYCCLDVAFKFVSFIALLCFLVKTKILFSSSSQMENKISLPSPVDSTWALFYSKRMNESFLIFVLDIAFIFVITRYRSQVLQKRVNFFKYCYFLYRLLLYLNTFFVKGAHL